MRPRKAWHHWLESPVPGAQIEPVSGPVAQHRVAGGDAEAVAALLRLRPVRVEDAHGHLGRVERHQPIRADPTVPVAQARQQRHHPVQVRRQVEDEVVVAQRLVLGQLHGRHDLT